LYRQLKMKTKIKSVKKLSRESNDFDGLSFPLGIRLSKPPF